jgi:ParB family chromosome partitioning protein
MAKANSRRALGRGLANLIPVEAEETTPDNEHIVYVDADAVRPNPFQPRQHFDEEEIAGLADSIKAQGLLQPLVLRKHNDTYQIVSGERRFRALLRLGSDKIPGIIRAKIADREMLEMALVENIQREDLSEVEKASTYNKLLTECRISHEELSKRVGKSRSAITNALRLLKLPRSVQEMIRDRRLGMGHARALLAVEGEQRQTELAERIVAESLTVRDIERLSQRHKSAPPRPSAPGGAAPAADPDLAEVIDKLRYRFGTAVRVVKTPDDKGKIEISFYGIDDLNRLLDLLLP